MKITAKLGLAISIVFAVLCFAVAFNGFTSLGGISDPAQLSDAKGYAGFWAFLGSVGVVFGALSWWIGRTESENE